MLPAASALAGWWVSVATKTSSLEREEVERRSRAHGCGSRHVVHEGDLAERLARTERPNVLSVDVDLRCPALDHVETIAGLTLAEDDRPGSNVNGEERLGEALDLRDRKRREDRNPAQQPYAFFERRRGRIECDERAPERYENDRQDEPHHHERSARPDGRHEDGRQERADRHREHARAPRTRRTRARARHREPPAASA